jgi:hypothetical protein
MKKHCKFLWCACCFLLISQGALRAQGNPIDEVNFFFGQDTIQFANKGPVHLAIHKEGAELLVLDGVYTQFNEKGIAIMGGYQLSRYTKSGTQWMLSKKGQPAEIKVTLPDAGVDHNGMDYNTFVKTDYGYVVCGPFFLAVFSNDLEPVFIARVPDFVFMAAAPLKGTSEIAILKASLSESSVYIDIFDYKKGIFILPGSQHVLSSDDERGYISAQANRLLQTPDGNLFVTLNTNEEFERQILGKLDIAAIRAGKTVEEFVLWQVTYEARLTELEIDATGIMHAVLRLQDPDDDTKELLQKVDGDTKVSSADDFESSFETAETADWDDAPAQGVLVHKLPDGTFLAIGRGKVEHQLEASVVLIWYTAEFKVIRQYRLPSLFLTANYKTEYGNFTRPNQISYFEIKSDGRLETWGLSCYPVTNLTTDANEFFSHYRESEAVWEVIPGFQKNELLLMNGTTIVSVNLDRFEAAVGD